MDLFTKKANSIIKRLNENKVVYSHHVDEDDETQPDIGGSETQANYDTPENYQKHLNNVQQQVDKAQAPITVDGSDVKGPIKGSSLQGPGSASTNSSILKTDQPDPNIQDMDPMDDIRTGMGNYYSDQFNKNNPNNSDQFNIGNRNSSYSGKPFPYYPDNKDEWVKAAAKMPHKSYEDDLNSKNTIDASLRPDTLKYNFDKKNTNKRPAIGGIEAYNRVNNPPIYTQEEDDQAPTTTTPTGTDEEKMGLNPQTLAAINVAKKMATKAQGGLFSNPQKKMNKAYGDLMNRIAGRIGKLSKNV
jgi:hypothetical protein